ncbi:MAG TPA: 6-phosphogluconolactonase [Acidimicrobiales bacterium]|nr:6-phosphogluconolactonase [Acidimicrobiales bacterium]
MIGELRTVEDVPGEFTSIWLNAYEHRASAVFVFAASGGATAKRCYERLAATAATVINWRSVEVVWTDERCVPPDSEHSNEGLAREVLISRIGGVGATYPMRCETGPDSYDALLRRLGAIDLAHLGLGADGHTASLFPGSPAMRLPPERLVAASRDPTGINPFPRMTLTLGALARSRLAVFTVEGEAKREALARVMANDPTAPATHVRARRVVWIVDRSAAGAD